MPHGDFEPYENPERIGHNARDRRQLTDEQRLQVLEAQLHDPERDLTADAELRRSIESLRKQVGKAPSELKQVPRDLVKEFNLELPTKTRDLVSEFGLELPKRKPSFQAPQGYAPDELPSPDDLMQAQGGTSGEAPKLGDPTRALRAVPEVTIAGTAKTMADTKFMTSDLELTELQKVRELISRMGGGEGVAPTPADFGKINTTKGKFYVSQALNAPDRSSVLAELEKEITQAQQAKDVARATSESFSEDIKKATPEDANFAEKALLTAAQSFAPTLGGLAAGAVTGGAAAPAIITGLVLGSGAAAASSYMEATESGEAMDKVLQEFSASPSKLQFLRDLRDNSRPGDLTYKAANEAQTQLELAEQKENEGDLEGAVAIRQEALKKFELQFKHGLTPEKKLRIAAIDGLLEGVGEGVSLKVAFKTGLPFFNRLAQTIVAEASSETVTQLMQDANAYLQYNPNATIKDFAYNAALAATAGAMGGAVISTAAHGAQVASAKADEDRTLRAIEELIRKSEPLGLLTPEEEALRRLQPTGRGEPIESPEQAFAHALRSNPLRAAELAEDLLKLNELDPSREMPLSITKRLYEEGKISLEDFDRFSSAVIAREADRVKGATELTEQMKESDRLERMILERDESEPIYVPTEEEVKELEFAKALERELEERGSTMDAEEREIFVSNRMGGFPGLIAQAIGPGLWSKTSDVWHNNDANDFRLATAGRSRGYADAHYYRVLAERNAAGLYPFGFNRSLSRFPDNPDREVRGWTTGEGANVTSEEQPLGTAIASFIDVGLGTKLANIASEWMKNFNPRGRVKIFDTDAARMIYRPDGATAGYHALNAEGSGLIYLGPERTSDDARLLQNLAHEFGHYIGATILRKMPEKIQRAVQRAWARDAKRFMEMDYDEAVKSSMGPIIERGDGSVRSKGRPLKKSLGSPYNRAYFFGFEEWKAHQMERLLTHDERMAKPVRKFFKTWEARIRQWFDKHHSEFAPNQTFQEFIALGVSLEREKALREQRFDEITKALAKYGLDDSLVDSDKVHSYLDKALTAMGATTALKEELRAASPQLAERAAEAIKRIGTQEAFLFVPSEASEASEVSAEEFTTVLEDAWLPGQPTTVVDMMMREVPLPKHKAASRMASFLKNSIKYSRFFRTEDLSGFEGHLDRFGWYKKWAYTLEQVAKVNPHIAQLQDYLKNVRAWARTKMAWVARSDERLRQWRDLNESENKVLTRFMIDQTLEGKFFDLSLEEVLKKYPLSPRAREMFERIKSDFEDFLSAVEGSLIASANKRLMQNPFATAAEITRIKKRFEELKGKPYFPLSRFGKYLVIVKATKLLRVKGKLYQPGDVMHFEAFDTDFARKAELDRIQGMYPSGTLKQDIASEEMQSIMGMPIPLLEALKTNPDIGLSEEQKQALDEYMYKIAPGQSFVKHLIQRRGVEGYSEDAKRAYANYFFHGASHLAKIQHAEPLSESLKSLKLTADLVQDDATKRRAIANYAAKHFKFIMQPESDWSSIRSAIAVLYLGGVLKTAFVNLTQVPMVTFPHLAAKFSDAKAIAALKRAYTDALAMYHVTKPLTKEEEAAISRWAQGEPMEAGDEKIVRQWSKLSQDEIQMLRQAVLEGWIDESQAMELAAMSEGSWLTRFKTTSKAGYYARWMSHYALVPFQAAEKLNRRVTAMAAFRLAKQAGASYDVAFETAREAVSATQFEYAKWNRAELLRGKKGIFFMFWQYMLNMLFFASGGDKGFWRWWALMLGVAGLQGLPFAEDLLNLATWALSRENTRTNAKYELRKLVGEFAEKLSVEPDLFLHGISRYGFGLIPFADMSGSMSMGRIIPALPEYLASPSNDWKDNVANITSEAGGATTALVMRMLQAAAQDDPDTLRRIERGMPSTLGQQLLTAMRWYKTGANEALNGADLTKFDVNDPWQLAEIVGKGIGFQPRSVAQGRPGDELQQGRDLRLLQQDFAMYYRVRREALMRKMDHEMEHGDSESVAQVRDAIFRFNEAVPSPSLRITNDQLRQMRRGRERSRAMQERGLPAQRLYRDLYRQVEEGKL